MTKTEYQRISGNTNIKWFCSRIDCLPLQNQPLNQLSTQLASALTKLDELLAKVNKIDTKSNDVSDIKAEVSVIKSSLSALEPRVSSVEERISAMEVKVDTIKSDSTPNNLEAFLAESYERSRCSKNIIVYNLIESSSSDVNVRKKHDSDLIIKLISPLLPTSPQDGIKSVRLGRPSAKKIGL